MDIHTDNFVTGDPAFAIDRNGEIVLWNDAAEQTFGFSADDALGEKCWNLMSGTDAYGNRYCCEQCQIREMSFRHEPVHSFQSTFRTATNQPRQFAVSCLSVESEGKPGHEMLLHICHPENNPTETVNQQIPATDLHGTLSHREVEVLALLAEKVSTRNIAAKMAISIRTVRTHIQHLMYKLQVHKRREAIIEGKRLKLI